MTKICGMTEQPTDTAGRKNGILCLNNFQIPVFLTNNTAEAFIFLCHEIQQFGLLQNLNVWAKTGNAQKSSCNFFSGNIFVENDTFFPVGTFPCICEGTILFSSEFSTHINQFLYQRNGTANHQINGGLVIFIMSCFHGVFIKAFVVRLIFQHTHATLCKKRITFFHL